MTTHLIPLKQWRAEQAVVNGVSLHAIEMRWLRGWYPEVKATLVTKNHKVKFVRQTEPVLSSEPKQPQSGR